MTLSPVGDTVSEKVNHFQILWDVLAWREFLQDIYLAVF